MGFASRAVGKALRWGRGVAPQCKFATRIIVLVPWLTISCLFSKVSRPCVIHTCGDSLLNCCNNALLLFLLYDRDSFLHAVSVQLFDRFPNSSLLDCLLEEVVIR